MKRTLSFTLGWRIAPAPVTLKGKTGAAEVRAETVPEAMGILRKRLSAEHHVPLERIEITSAQFPAPTPGHETGGHT